MKSSTILRAVHKRPWRDAASLILIAPVEKKNGLPTLTYLMLKRPEGTNLMSNYLVFPGGTVSECDSSRRWISLYEKAGISLKNINGNFMTKDAHRPQIYNKKKNTEADADDILPPEISLRLTALRESFEECGIFLSSTSDGSENPPELRDVNQVLKWQGKIKENPGEFLNLCEELRVVPNLGGLGEWSNWLTPVIYPSRFDTLFYIACLPRPLPVVLDADEAQSSQWSTAEELLTGQIQGRHNLIGPQFYELSRLKNVESVDEIKKLGDARRILGLQRWLPQISSTPDRRFTILPGDDLYLQNPEGSTKQAADGSLSDELLNSSKSWHRYAYSPKTGQIQIFINVRDQFGQIYPATK